jgi:drug/metabolite transporter (DMT)-like permease
MSTALFFVGCTVFSIMTDIITKSVLGQLPLPITLTLAQFSVSALCGFLYLHVLKLHPPQRISASGIKRLIPLMFFQATGFLFANLSVAAVAMSFMHTVKSCESVFTALLSFAVLGHVYSVGVYASLVPMIVGVSLSSLSEFSFTWWGLLAGMVSNLCFASRSVYSEAVFKTRLLDDLNLYTVVCAGAALVVAPIWAFTDLPKLTSRQATVSHTWLAFVLELGLCGALHFIYNTFSFMILSRTSPLTHVVLHAVRRMIVIAFAIAWFSTSITAVNVLGMTLVFLGVFWYAHAKAAHAHTAPKGKAT